MIIVVTYHLKALGNKQYLQIFTIMIKHEKDKKRIKHIILGYRLSVSLYTNILKTKFMASTVSVLEHSIFNECYYKRIRSTLLHLILYNIYQHF